MIDTLMVLWTKRFYGRLLRVLVAFLVLFLCVGMLMFLVTTSGVRWLSVASPSTSSGGNSGGPPPGSSSSSAPVPSATATFSAIPVILQNPCALPGQSTPTAATHTTGSSKTPVVGTGRTGPPTATVNVVHGEIPPAISVTSRPVPVSKPGRPISRPVIQPTTIVRPVPTVRPRPTIVVRPAPTAKPRPTTIVRPAPTVRPRPTTVVKPAPTVKSIPTIVARPTPTARVQPTVASVPTAVPVYPAPPGKGPVSFDPPSLVHGILDPLLPELFPNTLVLQRDCRADGLDILDSQNVLAIMRFIFWPTLLISILLTGCCLGLLGLSRRNHRRRHG